jgi:ribosomal protein L23
MLFGLIQSLNAQGKTEAAGMVRQEFEEAWKKADVTLRPEDL